MAATASSIGASSLSSRNHDTSSVNAPASPRRSRSSISSSSSSYHKAPVLGPPLSCEKTLKDFQEYLVSLERTYEVTPYLTEEEWAGHLAILKSFFGLLKEQIRDHAYAEDSTVKEILKSIRNMIKDENKQKQATATSSKNKNNTTLLHLKSLVGEVSRLLRIVQPVDLDKLLVLMEQNKSAGECMVQKDVLLLLGATGAGKTTTLQFLAGTSFQEVETEDGFDHLEPVHFRHPKLAKFKTSCGTTSITDSVQVVEVVLAASNGSKNSSSSNSSGKTSIVLCDIPGFGDTNGIEYDVSNGYGTVQALCKAKTVKPVLVLSHDGMGDRFIAVSDTLKAVSTLFSAKRNVDDSTLDLTPFGYVFTKYDDNKKAPTKIHKQFTSKLKNLNDEEKGNDMFVAFLNDIIQKTTPTAQIVYPLKGNPQKLLRGLWGSDSGEAGEKRKIYDPKSCFVPYLSVNALNKLELQAQLNLDKVQNALVSSSEPAPPTTTTGTNATTAPSPVNSTTSNEGIDYKGISYYLQQLLRLANVLPNPTIEKFAQRGQQIATEHVMSVRNQLSKESIQQRFSSSDNNLNNNSSNNNTIMANDERFMQELYSLKSEMDHFRKMEPLDHLLCAPGTMVSGDVYCANQIQVLIQMIGRELNGMNLYNDNNRRSYYTHLRQQQQDDMEELLQSRDKFFLILKRLQQVDSVFGPEWIAKGQQQQDGQSPYQEAFDRLYAMINNVLSQAENMELVFHGSTVTSEEDLKNFGQQTKFLALVIPELQTVLSGSSNSEKVDELEHRRQNLMQRLKNKIYEALTNVPLPNEGDIRSRDMNDGNNTQKPKEVLLKDIKVFLGSVELVLGLCDLLPEEIETWVIETCMARLDTTLVYFLHQLVVSSSERMCEIVIEDNPALQLALGGGDPTTKDGEGKASTVPRARAGFTNTSNNHSNSTHATAATTLTSFAKKDAGEINLSNHNSNATTTNRKKKAEELLQEKLSNIVEHFAAVHDFSKEIVTSTEEVIQWMNKVMKRLKEKQLTKVAPTLLNGNVAASSILQNGNVASTLQNGNVARAFKGYPSSAPSVTSSSPALTPSVMIYNENVNVIDETEKEEEEEEKSSLPLHQERGIERPGGDWGRPPLPSSGGLNNNERIRSEVGKVVESNFGPIENLRDSTKQMVRSELGRVINDLSAAPTTATNKDKKKRSPTSRRRQQEVNKVIGNLGLNIEDSTLLKNRYDTFQFDYKNYIKEGLAVADNHAAASDAAKAATERTLQNNTQQHFALLLGNYSRYLVQMAEVIAADYSVDYIAKVTDLSAVIFAYWSLKNVVKGTKNSKNNANGKNYTSSNSIGSSSNSSDGSSIDVNIPMYRSSAQPLQLMTPHATQVISVWCLLNCVDTTTTNNNSNNNRYYSQIYQNLVNQLIEIKQGEGKSVVLATAAIILAMLGCDEIYTLCYNSHLSGRDFTTFQTMFDDFGVLSKIRYGTTKNLSEYILKKPDNIWDISFDVIFGKRLPPQQQNGYITTNKSGKDDDGIGGRILMIDEVDALFKNEFFGQGSKKFAFSREASINTLMQFIWDNILSLDEEELITSGAFQQCLAEISNDAHSFIEFEVKKMLTDARKVRDGQEHPKYVVSEGKIGYKYVNGLRYKVHYGYETMFAYIKEHAAGKVSRSTMLEQLGMKLRCGKLSYAEMPNTYFDTIIGVSGTLKGISGMDQQVLKDVYDLTKYTYMPSLFGDQKLAFPTVGEKDLILCDDEAEYFSELRNEIDRRRKPAANNNNDDSGDDVTRPVIVFFNSKKTLVNFYESQSMKNLQSGKKRAFTEEVPPAATEPDKNQEHFSCAATEQGAVSLLLREYGRGIDYRCHDSQIIDAGGVHVIQAFFSPDVYEEIQIMSRSARLGTQGSYSMVLNVDQISEDFDVAKADIVEMRKTPSIYSSLDEKRRELHSTKFRARADAVKEAEKDHYRTESCRKAIIRGEDRDEVLRFLFEFNGYNTGGAFTTGRNAPTKALFVNERKEQRMDGHLQQEEIDKKRVIVDDENEKASTLFSLLKNRMKGHQQLNLNYYELLGVSKDAADKDVIIAYRRLAKICHPNKYFENPVDEKYAKEIFLQINEARKVLLDYPQRVEYDAKL